MNCPQCGATCYRDDLYWPWYCVNCGWDEDYHGFPMLPDDWQHKFAEEDMAL